MTEEENNILTKLASIANAIDCPSQELLDLTLKKHELINIDTTSTNKPFRGTIKNWVIIRIEDATEKHFSIMNKKGIIPAFLMGNILEDPTGRFMPEYTFRSSWLAGIDTDRNIVETANSIYKLSGKGCLHYSDFETVHSLEL